MDQFTSQLTLICEVQLFDDMTGAVGIIRGAQDGPTIMLGVVRNIMTTDLQSKLKGNVKIFPQPAEERIAGAKAMIESGVLENPRVDRVIAGHMAPDLPVGTVGVFKGLGYASADRFELNITGQGTHGARPEEGNDPIVAGGQIQEPLSSVFPIRNLKSQIRNRETRNP